MTPRVKVCCISSLEEARLAVALGASALGLVSEMPSGPGVIDLDTIAEIVATVPPPIGTFLLTCRTDPEEIVSQQRRVRVNTVQLCDRPRAGAHARLRDALPGISLVQVVHVVDERSYDQAIEVAPAVDALLLDSGNPALAVKELGGTGRVHDWGVSARIVADAPVPVFLAGGLGARNVSDAIAAVRPFGIDLCSGVRSGGRLDADLLRRFMAAVSDAPAAA